VGGRRSAPARQLTATQLTPIASTCKTLPPMFNYNELIIFTTVNYLKQLNH